MSLPVRIFFNGELIYLTPLPTDSGFVLARTLLKNVRPRYSLMEETRGPRPDREVEPDEPLRSGSSYYERVTVW